MKPIYLVCGVPGSGKSWVCEQLGDKYNYLSHDSFIGMPKHAYQNALIKLARSSDKPVLGDVPFMISILIENLKASNATVIPYFVIENPLTTRTRYEAREGKPIPPQHLTRIATVKQRAIQYRAPKGTSTEVLALLLKA